MSVTLIHFYAATDSDVLILRSVHNVARVSLNITDDLLYFSIL